MTHFFSYSYLSEIQNRIAEVSKPETSGTELPEAPILPDYFPSSLSLSFPFSSSLGPSVFLAGPIELFFIVMPDITVPLGGSPCHAFS